MATFTEIKAALQTDDLHFLRLLSYDEGSGTNDVTSNVFLNTESAFLTAINALGITTPIDTETPQSYTLTAAATGEQTHTIAIGSLTLSITQTLAAYRLEGAENQEYIEFYQFLPSLKTQIYTPRLYKNGLIYEILGERKKSFIIDSNKTGYINIDGTITALDSATLKTNLQTVTSRAFFFREVNGSTEITGLTPNQILYGSESGGIAQTSSIVIKDGNIGVEQLDPVYSFDLLDSSGAANIRIKSTSGNSFLRLDAATGNESGVNFQVNGANVFTNAATSEKWSIYSQFIDSNILEVQKSGRISIKTNGTENFRIGETGNVSIGQILDTHPFNVYIIDTNGVLNKELAALRYSPSDNLGATSFSIQAGSSVNARTSIQHVTTGGNGEFGTYNDTNIINRSTSTSFKAGNINFVTNNAIRVTIGGGAQAGNVGVNTTTPTEKIHINGNIRAEAVTTYADTATAAAAGLQSGVFFKVSNGDGTATLHIKE